jgi:hypothetical protein
MRPRTHNAVRLIAVVLNIPTALWGIQYWLAAAQTPLRFWDYKVPLLIAFSLAPVFALVAIMGKSDATRDNSNRPSTGGRWQV